MAILLDARKLLGGLKPLEVYRKQQTLFAGSPTELAELEKFVRAARRKA